MLHFQPEAMQVLMEHNWPGNVRELENVVERAVVLATDAAVPLDVLPDSLLQANGVRLHRGEGGPLPADASLFEIVNDFERRMILERLEQLQLEPDGSRRKPARAAVHAESEDQAAGYQDSQEGRQLGCGARPGLSAPASRRRSRCPCR